MERAILLIISDENVISNNSVLHYIITLTISFRDQLIDNNLQSALDTKQLMQKINNWFIILQNEHK